MEADIRPFRGILLGLFFVTTGSSLDLALLFQQWPIVLALTGGLISVKVGIIGSVAPLFGLTRSPFSYTLCIPCLHLLYFILTHSVSLLAALACLLLCNSEQDVSGRSPCDGFVCQSSFHA